MGISVAEVAKRGVGGAKRVKKVKRVKDAPKKSAKRKASLAELDMDEFMRTACDDGDDSGGEEEEQRMSSNNKDIDKNDNIESSSAVEHKQVLARLQKQDPEFYKFLQQEDKELLNFDVSDEDSGDDKQPTADGDAESSDDDQGNHSEGNQDDADEASAASGSAKKKKKSSEGRTRAVTMPMVRRWAAALQEGGSESLVRSVVAAFKAAVHEADGEAHESSSAATPLAFSVEGSSVFNAVVRLCLTRLLPALTTALKLSSGDESSKKPIQPSSSKSWSRIKPSVKSYLGDVVKLTTSLSESNVLNPVLKHVNQLVPYYACFPKLSRTLIKRLVHVWSTGEETSRVLAFLSIVKLVRLQQGPLLERTLKTMYLAYVRNTKFTSPSTLTLISFMQRSLVEMLALDTELTYQYAFIYIRQLAVHLRNAVVTKKKESHQTVYNWQFVHSLGLWARLLGTVYPSDSLQPLIYPLVQIVVGTIRLIPTAKFYPLRFHCVRLLNILSAKTRTFIPTLPFLLEVLEATDFNKKFSKASVKPFDFSCMLKLSKAQLQDRAFKDGTIEQLYELILEQMHIHSHTIGFPELVLPAIIQMRAFSKKCKVAAYCKQMKQLVEKAEETSRTISQRRSQASLSLADFSAMDAWEARSKEDGTPLSKFWTQWQKVRQREITAQRAVAGSKAASGSAMSDNPRSRKANEPPLKKHKKEATKATSDSEDDYSDLNSDELEELAKSADDGESSDSAVESSEETAAAVQEEDSDGEDNAEDLVEDFVMSSESEDSS